MSTMPRIALPQAGESAGNATVRRWRKNVGDAFVKGDVILEVETDEGLVEIEAPIPATLTRILVQPGQTIPGGSALAELSDGAASLSTISQAMGRGEAMYEDIRKQQRTTNQQETKVSAKIPAGSVIPVLMPQAGQSMEEGTLVKWHVKPGERIRKGQIIFEIETDKATMEVEAVDEGRLARIVLDEGGTKKVKEPVAYLAENDADVDAFIAREAIQPSASSSTTPGHSEARRSAAPDSARAPITETGRVKASPAARRIANERGVDLKAVGSGSGPGGRILSSDVLNAPSMPANAGAPSAAPVAVPAFVAPPATGEGLTRKKMSKMRLIIARNLLASKQTIPHFYIKLTIDAGPLYSFYQGEKAKYPVSLNDVIVAACAKGVMEFPAFRGRIEGDEIVTFPNANIGIAVGMDDGLVVPVVMNAEQRTLAQIAQETKRIANNARGGKIEGMGSGVFTITNLGMFGTEEFTGIINPPEAAILAVGAIKEDIIVSGGTMRPGRVMTMTLSADHRIIDGMLAAKFMARLKQILEYPQQLA
jgi:pyruvate dehydrogenase E2 component (dihydrolipoamide acetyltransferase)